MRKNYQPKFSLKKLSIGLVSVAVTTALAVSQENTVEAVTADSAATAAPASDFEAEFNQAMTESVNELRALNNLSPLTDNAQLAEAASIKTDQIAESGNFSHEGDYKALAQAGYISQERADEYETAGVPVIKQNEPMAQANLAQTYTSGEVSTNANEKAEQVINMWTADVGVPDRGHRTQMLSKDWEEVGAGTTRVGGTEYFSQYFGSPSLNYDPNARPSANDPFVPLPSYRNFLDSLDQLYADDPNALADVQALKDEYERNKPLIDEAYSKLQSGDPTPTPAPEQTEPPVSGPSSGENEVPTGPENNTPSTPGDTSPGEGTGTGATGGSETQTGDTSSGDTGSADTTPTDPARTGGETGADPAPETQGAGGETQTTGGETGADPTPETQGAGGETQSTGGDTTPVTEPDTPTNPADTTPAGSATTGGEAGVDPAPETQTPGGDAPAGEATTDGSGDTANTDRQVAGGDTTPVTEPDTPTNPADTTPAGSATTGGEAGADPASETQTPGGDAPTGEATTDGSGATANTDRQAAGGGTTPSGPATTGGEAGADPASETQTPGGDAPTGEATTTDGSAATANTGGSKEGNQAGLVSSSKGTGEKSTKAGDKDTKQAPSTEASPKATTSTQASSDPASTGSKLPKTGSQISVGLLAASSIALGLGLTGRKKD